MSENKKSLINLVPESIDNAVKNITDKPTENMGTTLADIWYLVFGGISQAAGKRKLKYSYNLQKYETELKKKINEIPTNNLLEPNVQIIAPALEASKYCIENCELRDMFSNLISSSMNNELSDFSQPIFVDILKNLKPLDCKILKGIYENSDITIHFKTNGTTNFMFNIFLSLDKLTSYGLIQFETMINYMKKNFFSPENLNVDNYLKYIRNNKTDELFRFLNQNTFEKFYLRQDSDFNCTIDFKLKPLVVTPLGMAFKIVCVK